MAVVHLKQVDHYWIVVNEMDPSAVKFTSDASAPRVSSVRQTHTYAELLVSSEVYDFIAKKLREASYDHVFMEDGTIDMHGIGICAPCSYCTNWGPCENCMNTGRQRG